MRVPGDDIDVVAAGLADEYASALAAVAAAEAEVVRVLSRAADVALRRASQLPRAAARDAELPMRALAAELAVSARQSDRTVQRRLDEAYSITTHFPATLDALAAGHLTTGHVRVILEHGLKIDDRAAREAFEAEAIARAEVTTAGRLNASLSRLVEQVQPRTFAERHRVAREGRGVWIRDDVDGMAELILRGPAVPVHGMHDMISQMARKVTDAASAAAAEGAEPDPRTVNQVRADLLAEIVLTHTVDPESGEGLSDGYGGLASIRAVVNVTVPALALAGVTADPAELVGRAPVDIDTARILALSAPGWERVLADPITGGVLAVDRYTRSADLTRYLRVRDAHCRFPGCRMPARRCDVDHGHDYALGGSTDHRNLACFCRRHHTLKGETPWRVTHLPAGVLEWTSPGGKTYVDTPPPVSVGFVPDLEPAPF